MFCMSAFSGKNTALVAGKWYMPGGRSRTSPRLSDFETGKNTALVASIWNMPGGRSRTSPKQADKPTYGNPLSEIIMVFTT